MDIIAGGLANLTGILFLTLAAVTVAKAFQIGGTLSEIKELLADIKRNTNSDAPVTAPFASTESAENLLRAVSAELDHPVPAAIDLEPKR
jgi:hypothetical protein